MIGGDYKIGKIPNKLAMGQSANLYGYAMSNPLRYIDPTGYIIELCENATPAQTQQFNDAIRYLQTSETGAELIRILEESPEVITVTFITDPNHNAYFPGTRIVQWDPRQAPILGNGYHVASPAIVLAHELGHAAQELDGIFDELNWDVGAIEAHNIETWEIPIGTELGEFTRTHHADVSGWLVVDCPTAWGIRHRNHYWWHYFWPGNWGNPMFTFENLNSSSSTSLLSLIKASLATGTIVGAIAIKLTKMMTKTEFHHECG